jgi:hypothetical protein
MLYPTAVPLEPLLGYARQAAQTAVAAAAAAAPFGAIPVARRRHDAHSAPSPHELPVEQLPPPPPYPPAGYALTTLGPFVSEAPPHNVPTPRGHPHPYGLPPSYVAVTLVRVLPL